jgi:hypothetical protein
MIYWLKVYEDEMEISPPWYEAGQCEKKSEAPEGSRFFRKATTWQAAMDKIDFAEPPELGD